MLAFPHIGNRGAYDKYPASEAFEKPFQVNGQTDHSLYFKLALPKANAPAKVVGSTS